MMAAVAAGKLKAVKCLLSFGADPNGCGGCFLRYACRYSHSNIAKQLLSHGAELNLVRGDVSPMQTRGIVEAAQSYRTTVVWQTWLQCVAHEPKDSPLTSFKKSTIFERNVLSIMKSMISVDGDDQFFCERANENKECWKLVSLRFLDPVIPDDCRAGLWSSLLRFYVSYCFPRRSWAVDDAQNYGKKEECDICLKRPVIFVQTRAQGETKYFKRMSKLTRNCKAKTNRMMIKV
eukprot:TRINITY_DN1627_c0_g2_i5.p1 TRINITY_DN1627_c0_g2~~TRINITY_DN1627_c0_g2_i5.p1  ORF type:complete len:234 (-),score=32.40 TRINITY_DN1627_c0_g2_i5:50-751(-)